MRQNELKKIAITFLMRSRRMKVLWIPEMIPFMKFDKYGRG